MINRLSHVEVAVSDLQRAREFYCDLLGFVPFAESAEALWLRAHEEPKMVAIIIEDEGPGIPEAKLEHVFDRFYTERPRGERFGQHSGLGLSISRQIVEALRGRISAENRRGANGNTIGARFTVLLPKA